MADRRSSSAKVIGAYNDADHARQAAEKARRAAPHEARVRPPTKEDEFVALESEMREEVRNVTGPFTKEVTKGIVRTIPFTAGIGAVLLLPFGLIEVGDFSLGLRLFVAAAVGGTAGAVAGFVIGGGAEVSEKAPGEMAAERGTLVVTETDDPDAVPDVAKAMADDAIRVDVVTEENVPVGEVTTEEEQQRPDSDQETTEAAESTAGVLKEPRGG